MELSRESMDSANTPANSQKAQVELQQQDFPSETAADCHTLSCVSPAIRPHTFQNLTTYNPVAQPQSFPRSVSQYDVDKMESKSNPFSPDEGASQVNQAPKPCDTVVISSPVSSTGPSKSTQATESTGGSNAGDDARPTGTAVIGSFQRPGYTYEELAIMALEVMPSNKGSVSEIFDVIQLYFPFFKIKQSKTWKSSLRHSISRSPYIRRVQIPQDKPEGSIDVDSGTLTHIDSAISHVTPSGDHVTASNAPQRKGRGAVPRLPIVWELYEPAEDDARGKRKPRRDSLPPLPPAGSLPTISVNPQMSRGEVSSAIAGVPVNLPGVPQPGFYSHLGNPKVKVDQNANIIGPTPSSAQQQTMYGATVSPEIYPFVASLLDLSQNKVKPSTTTRYLPYDFNQRPGAKKLSPQDAKTPRKISPMPSAFPVQRAPLFHRPETTFSDDVHKPLPEVTVTASGHDYAKLPPPYYAAGSKSSSFTTNQSQLAKPPQRDGLVAGSPSDECYGPIELKGSHHLMPSKSFPQTTYAWPGNVYQNSQSLMVPVPSSQHSQHQLPGQLPFTSFQRENTARPVSWKVQNGYLVQTQSDPSPPPTAVLPSQMTPASTFLPSTGSNFGIADTDPTGHQLFQPWQVAQSLHQYPYMQYQVPQAQRFPLYATPAAAAAPAEMTSPGRPVMIHQNMRGSIHSSYAEQDKSFGSASSTPSLVDSGIVRDSSRLDSLSPEGSEDTCSLPERPSSQDGVIDV